MLVDSPGTWSTALCGFHLVIAGGAEFVVVLVSDISDFDSSHECDAKLVIICPDWCSEIIRSQQLT